MIVLVDAESTPSGYGLCWIMNVRGCPELHVYTHCKCGPKILRDMRQSLRRSRRCLSCDMGFEYPAPLSNSGLYWNSVPEFLAEKRWVDLMNTWAAEWLGYPAGSVSVECES